MNEEQALIIEPLNLTHDRENFNCGNEALNDYLKKQANQDVKRLISRVFVATQTQSQNTIVGYYTLSSLSIETNQLPQNLVKKLPKHPIPAALLGRLAINQQQQGKGLGPLLITNAIKRILSISNEIAIYALVVDAIDESAIRLYQKFGFIKLEHSARRLFLPLKSIS